MLTVMKEMPMASIVATAGQNNFFQYFGIGARDRFLVQNCSSFSEVCGSLLAGQRPRRGHVGRIEEINDRIQ